MKKISHKIIYLPLALAISGCGLEYVENVDKQPEPSNEIKLFGVNAITGISPWIQSENDGWQEAQVSETQANLADITAVLINNNGESDTVDIQFADTDTSHMFKLKSEIPMDLSSYQNGYLEFGIRAKSDVPSSMIVSIDNDWPNRSSYELAGEELTNALTGSGEWETLSVAVNCFKPVEGATAIDLTQVGWPFHLDVKQSFNFEITDVAYRSAASKEAINCDLDPIVQSLNNGEVALYYSGDISQAVDYTSAYPLNSFGFSVEEVDNQVVHVVASDDGDGNGWNGGVFLGDDDVTNNKDFSSHKDDFVSLDLKVTSYGESNNLEVRMDGTTVDYGTNVALNKDILPEDNQWYRCQIPVLEMIPEGNLTDIEKAIYISGVWDSMSGLEFSFANVSIEKQSDGYDAASPCTKL